MIQVINDKITCIYWRRDRWACAHNYVDRGRLIY